MQFEHCEDVRIACNGLLEILAVLPYRVLSSRNDLRYHREAVAGRGFRVNRSVAAALRLADVTALRNRHRGGLRPIFFALRVGHARLLDRATCDGSSRSTCVKLALRRRRGATVDLAC